MEENWTTDRWGRLQRSGIHDAKLVGFAMRAGTSLQFSIEAQDGEVSAFHLAALHTLCVEDLWEAAIIGSVRAWRCPAATGCDALAMAWKSLLASRAVNLGAEIERLVRHHPEAVLLHVSCSYGGEWAALADKLTIETSKPRHQGKR